MSEHAPNSSDDDGGNERERIPADSDTEIEDIDELPADSQLRDADPIEADWGTDLPAAQSNDDNEGSGLRDFENPAVPYGGVFADVTSDEDHPVDAVNYESDSVVTILDEERPDVEFVSSSLWVTLHGNDISGGITAMMQHVDVDATVEAFTHDKSPDDVE